MLALAPETERLAREVARHIGRQPDELIRRAIEREAREHGINTELPIQQQRMTAAEIMEFGARAARRPVLDSRSPREITDDLNSL